MKKARPWSSVGVEATMNRVATFRRRGSAADGISLDVTRARRAGKGCVGPDLLRAVAFGSGGSSSY